jgi:hypothetical protein
MAGKTYLPTLVKGLERTCVYIARYRATILKYLPEGSETALDNVLDACQVLIDIIVPLFEE